MSQDAMPPTIDARQWWNDTGVDVVAGVVYDVRVTGTWNDAGHPSGPEGWEGNALINWFSWARRARPFPWGALIGSVDRKTPYLHLMPGTMRAPATGRLYGFFNDARGFYWNNGGALTLTVTRTPDTPGAAPAGQAGPARERGLDQDR
jgi:hypothetical protein